MRIERKHYHIFYVFYFILYSAAQVYMWILDQTLTNNDHFSATSNTT